MLPPQMEISHRRSDLSGNSHQYNGVWACPDVGRRTDAWCKDAMLCCSMSTPLTHSLIGTNAARATTQLIQVDPLAVDQNRIADRVGRSEACSEVGAPLKLHRHMRYIGPAALEFQRNRDHVSFVSSRIEDNEITSAPFPSMSGERQVRVNDDPLIRKTGVVDAALIPAQRLTDISFAYRRPDSVENVTHGSRDSSSLFCRSADRL